jgi:hypothetical protein
LGVDIIESTFLRLVMPLGGAQGRERSAC